MKQFSKELGKVSITPKGDWDSSITNERLDIVYDRRNNQAYIAKQDVPIGVDIDNREYWQPLNVSGYADNNFINLTAENENGTITAYESLEEAVATIFPINRRVGATLSFYNLNSDRLDRQAEFELWQFNSTDLANWENKDYWNNIYYNWNVFAGWYIDADALKNHVETPNVGQYAYVGSNLNDAILYQCRTNGTWTNTGIKVRNYISVVVSGNITIGKNGNWFSDGEDTGIPATPAVDEQLDNIITKHESLSRTVQGIAVTGGASTATNVTYNNEASGLNAENAQDAINEVGSIGYFAKRGGIVNISTNYNSTNTAEVLTLEQAIAKVPSSDRVLGFQGRFKTENGWETYIFKGESLSSWSNTHDWLRTITSGNLKTDLEFNEESDRSTMSLKGISTEIAKLKSPSIINYNTENIEVIKAVYIDLTNATEETISKFNFSSGTYMIYNSTTKILACRTNNVIDYGFSALFNISNKKGLLTIPQYQNSGITVYAIVDLTKQKSEVQKYDLNVDYIFNKENFLNIVNNIDLESLKPEVTRISKDVLALNTAYDSIIGIEYNASKEFIVSSEITQSSDSVNINNKQFECIINADEDSVVRFGLKVTYSNDEVTYIGNFMKPPFGSKIYTDTKLIKSVKIYVYKGEVKKQFTANIAINTGSFLTAKNINELRESTNSNATEITTINSSDYRQDVTITYLADSAKDKINVESLYVKWLNPDVTYPTKFSLRVYYNKLISNKYYNGFAIVAYGEGYDPLGAFVCQNYKVTSESTPFETNYINKLVKLTGTNCEAYIKVISATTDANRDFIIKNRSFYPNPTYNEYYIETKEVSIPTNVATIDSLNVVDNKVEQLKNLLDTQSQQILTVENQVTNKLNEFQEIIDSEENKSKFIGVFNSDLELPTEGIKEDSYAYANNPRTEWLFKNGRWEDTGIEMPITVLSEEDYVKKNVFDTTIKELRFGKENTLAGEYIYISTQEEFDNLLATIKQKVDEYIALSTENLYTISILIHGGIYKFSSVQKLELDSYTKAYNISINISAVPGEKVYVISDGEELTPNDAIALTPTHYICNISDYNTSYGFVDQDFNYIKVQNTGNVNLLGINLMTERPTFDLELKQIKFKIPDELSILKNKELEYFKNSYLYFTCQWFDYTAHNIYSDDTYIYATYDTSGENINAIERDVVDEKYSLPTRFYITNIPDIKLDVNQVLISNNKIYIPRNISKLYITKYSSVFSFKNLHFSNITLSNIDFVGSSYNKSNCLIKYMDCNNVYCNYNVFKNINSNGCVSVGGSVSPYVADKESHTGTQTYYSFNNDVSYNKFIDIGLSAFEGGRISGVEFSYNFLYNTGILRCNQAIMITGKDNHVSYNKFINIPFSSIYLLGPVNYFTAVIEYNEFYNTNDYNNTYIAHSLIDSGVIYSGWHSDSTTIRYNIFHDKRSYANYRGIMVDSGGYNVSIYGNLFYRIQNSFTIDLRQVTLTHDQEIRDRNTNNFVYDNIIVGTYKLMGNPEHPNEVYLGNNIYCTKYSIGKSNVTTNAQLTGEQVEDSDLFIDNDVVYLTKIPKFSVPSFIKSRLVIGV